MKPVPAQPIPAIDLTAGERRVLQMMMDFPEEELTQAIPGGWYFDLERIDGRICTGLLRKVVISTSYRGSGDDYFLYYVNEWGRDALQKCNAALQNRAGRTHKKRVS